MTTYYLWKKTNKEYFLAILFSLILTPFALLFDILCPFMLIGNVLFIGYSIFEIINKRKTLKQIMIDFFDEEE